MAYIKVDLCNNDIEVELTTDSDYVVNVNNDETFGLSVGLGTTGGYTDSDELEKVVTKANKIKALVMTSVSTWVADVLNILVDGYEDDEDISVDLYQGGTGIKGRFDNDLTIDETINIIKSTRG